MYRIKGIALIVLLCCLGCGNDTPVEPEPTVNTAPKIDALILPQKVEAGSTVNLQVVARDAENDNLTIHWQVSEGHVDIATSIWTAPKDTTTVEITVFVSDRSNEAVSAKKSVQVIRPQVPVVTPVPSNPPPPNPPVVNTPVEPIVPEPEDIGIIPGREIAGIKLGDTLPQVEALHGKSTREDDSFIYLHLGLGGTLEGGRVMFLLIFDRSPFKTAGGNGIGSRRADVEKEFGIAEKLSVADDRIIHWYFRKGISFGYGVNSIVETLSVFEPVLAAPGVVRHAQAIQMKHYKVLAGF